MNTFGERLKAVMDARHVTQTGLASLTNVTRSAVSNWVHSEDCKKVSARHILGICREHDINPFWLVYGEGNMEVVAAGAVDDDLVAKAYVICQEQFGNKGITTEACGRIFAAVYSYLHKGSGNADDIVKLLKLVA